MLFRSPGGPAVMLGGSSEAAARRAARIADGFMPSVPAVWDFYRDEVIKLGRPDPGPSPTGQNRIVALADDADAGWAAMESCTLFAAACRSTSRGRACNSSHEKCCPPSPEARGAQLLELALVTAWSGSCHGSR